MATSRHEHRHNVPAARDLRARETPVEELLWNELRGRRLDGLKFRRQHPIGPFVIDFCCAECRLAIELDGGIHDNQREHDAEREALLAAAGYRFLRFPNQAVRDRLPDVLEAIRVAASEAPMWRRRRQVAAPGSD
ncbi:MAG: endonuclease domain-containing protein [Thermomicrobiales bacterium]